MLPFFADLPAMDSPTAIGWVLGSVAALCVIANQIGDFVERYKEKPPPALTYATKEELDAELGRERGARKRIHEEMAENQADIRVLEKMAEVQAQQLTNLDGKMDQVLMRLPRLPSR